MEYAPKRGSACYGLTALGFNYSRERGLGNWGFHGVCGDTVSPCLLAVTVASKTVVNWRKSILHVFWKAVWSTRGGRKDGGWKEQETSDLRVFQMEESREWAHVRMLQGVKAEEKSFEGNGVRPEFLGLWSQLIVDWDEHLSFISWIFWTSMSSPPLINHVPSHGLQQHRTINRINQLHNRGKKTNQINTPTAFIWWIIAANAELLSNKGGLWQKIH